PSMGALLVFVVVIVVVIVVVAAAALGAARRVRLVDLLEQPGHAVAGVEPLVVLEHQLGRMAQAQALAERAADEPGGLLQSGQAGLPLLLGAEHAHEDAGLPEVGAEVDAGDRHEPDARVLELAGDELGHLLADLLAQPVRAPRHRISVLTSRTWMSRACSA